MKIIGIDASTTSTGVACFSDGILVEKGLIKSSLDNVYDRIEEIHSGVRSFVEKHNCDYIFIENVPLGGNRNVAEKLLVLQGVIFGIAIEFDCGFVPFQPSQWRKLACVKPENRKRDSQKKAAIELVESKYGFGYTWNPKTDEDTGFSDICEAILIGEAGIAYSL